MKTGLKMMLCFMCVAVLAIASCSGGGGENNKGNDNSNNVNNNEITTEYDAILRNLGVTEVDNPPDAIVRSTQDTNETIDPEEWHPLKKPYTVFTPTAEILMSYAGYYYLIEDSTYAGSTISESSGTSSLTKTSTKADLDGDGIEEIVIFYISGSVLYAYVYHDGSLSSVLEIDITLSSNAGGYYQKVSTTTGIASLTFPYLQAASGDIDGDGSDEIILADYNRIHYLKLDASGSSASILNSKTVNYAISSVTAGDINGDGKYETGICTLGEKFSCYDEDFNELTSIAKTSAAEYQEACFGDFDGDRIDELALCDVEQSNNRLVISAYETVCGTGINTASRVYFYHTIPTLHRFYPYSTSPYASYRALPVAVDIDGNGSKDLFVSNTVYRNILTTAESFYTLSNGDAWLKQASVGDTDGDAMEDIVLFYHDIDQESNGFGVYYGYLFGTIKTIGMEGSSVYQKYGTTLSLGVANSGHSSTEIPLNGYIYSAADNSLVLSAANVDRDSCRVKYLGHELMYTDPSIVAVVASPPYWSDVADKESVYADSIQDWETFFGQTSIESSSDETSTGYSVGITVEFEQEFSIFGLKGAQFKTSSSFTKNVDWKLSTTYEKETYIQRSCVAGEDKVIFTSIPMDVYYYEVMDADSDSNNIAGSIINISVPREYTFHTVTRKFFNNNNGTVPDVDSTNLIHSFGYPFSYHTRVQKDDLIDVYGGFDSGSALPVTQGEDNEYSGMTEVEIKYTETTEETWSIEEEIENSTGGGGGGLSVLIDSGFKTGCSYSTSAGTGTSFGGTVGYLPTKYFTDDDYYYKAGLFAYPYFDEENYRLYWVVDYWVEE